MKRDEDCKGCSWNFGSPIFPCQFCEEHDLFIDFPYHISEDKKIQKMIVGMISATIYLLLGYALDIDISEIINNAKVQEQD